ncbi:MAG: pyridoxal phosphate-dependent aminotransferase [Euryarchaeota archaeon]|nr:pyridoxal phosphate-dependent aminotransferase [Euryarchaeota archaeon]
MRFASRLKDIDISGIRKMFDLAKGGDMINLAIGEPDFDIPQEAREAVARALEAGLTHYTPNKGIPELRARLAEKLEEENGIGAAGEDMIVTSGGSEGLLLAIMALVDVGDEVLIPDPGFVSYGPIVRMASGVPIPYPLREEGGFVPHLEQLETLVTRKTRLIVVNTPSNPTGAVFPRRVIKGIADLSEDRGIPVLSDEIYERIVYEGRHYSVGRYTENAITVNGFSKAYAMTGLRLGYVHAAPEAIEAMLKVHQYVQACASSLSQYAALAAMDAGGFVPKMVRAFRGRRDLFLRLLRKMEGTSCVRPKGAFYAFPNFSRHGSSKVVAMRLLQEARVVATPGTAFGTLGEGYIRFSYAASEEKIREGMERVRECLSSCPRPLRNRSQGRPGRSSSR